MTTPDPLEEALEQAQEWGTVRPRGLAAIRVLKRGHFALSKPKPEAQTYMAGRMLFAVVGPGSSGRLTVCACGCSWPCPVLAEAAKALRGEP